MLPDDHDAPVEPAGDRIAPRETDAASRSAALDPVPGVPAEVEPRRARPAAADPLREVPAEVDPLPGGSPDAEAQRTAERAAARMGAGDAASEGAGVRLAEVGPGRATTTLTVTEQHVNGHGICHGGYVFLLADTALAYASNSFGPAAVAAGAQIEFLRPARAGDRLEAVARLRTTAGRSGLYDVTVRRGADVVAEFRGRATRLRAPQARA